mmetsp:Transcript_51329/g.133367  ORF Transcript_51329/g.133367 Transcript_51329/m.133367 type:complete len:240 (+) Transcript_51329:1332-2051(+)
MPVPALALGEADLYNSVRARRFRVHRRLGNGAQRGPLLESTLDVLWAAHRQLGQTFHVHAQLRMLAHAQCVQHRHLSCRRQACAHPFLLWHLLGIHLLLRSVEEVDDLLVVDFEEAHCNTPALEGLVGKQAIAEPRDQPSVRRRAEHGVRLARASLAIGKHGGVVSIDDLVENVSSEGVIDVLLRVALIEDVVVRKVFGVVRLSAFKVTEAQGILSPLAETHQRFGTISGLDANSYCHT